MTVLAFTGIAPTTPSVGARASAVIPIADLDGDRVFDDLEARVEASSPDAKLSVLVQLKERLTEARFDALGAAVGGVTLTRWLPIVHGFAATVSPDQVRELAGSPLVAQVELNGVVHAYNDSAQLSFGVSKARSDDPELDGNIGDATTYGAGDIVIAVIDSGIDEGHAELDDSKVIAFANCLDQPSPTSCTTPPVAFDDNRHGTHVAGTIAGDGEAGFGRYRGAAPRAALVGVKVLDDQGTGSNEGVIAGIQWTIDNASTLGIEVVNLSLGADGCFNADEGMTSQAVNAAVAAGLHVFVAAGNEGPDLCTVGAPGVATNVVTVGAMADLGTRIDPGNRWRPGFGLAPFSSRGPTLDDQIKPDVVGPGVDITSAAVGSGNGFVALQGTSMATPFVAGVAAHPADSTPLRRSRQWTRSWSRRQASRPTRWSTARSRRPGTSACTRCTWR
jgi:serine protease AprX